MEREALRLDAGFLLPRELKTALIPEVLILVSPLLIMGRWEQRLLTEPKASSTQFGESAAQLWRDANLCGKNKQF